jgi:hypothetical protein
MTSKALRLSGLAKEFDALAAASSSTLVVYEYTATANQTVFSGVDNNGLTLNYIAGNTLVVYNEGMLQKTVDYATTSSSVLTLQLGAEAGALVRMYAFGTFAVANVYTKPESDALYYNKVQSDGLYLPLTAAKGYIDGLQLFWVSLTSIQINPGSAYIPSSGKILQLPTAVTVTPPAGVTGFAHLYLYDNAGTPAVEMLAVEPVAYWNTAYQKTGDTARRYLGSVLLNSGSAYKFLHYPLQNRMSYAYGTPSASPFNVLSGGTSLTPATVATTTVCPATSTALEALLSGSGTSGSFYIGNEDQATPLSASNWVLVGLTTGYMAVTIPLSIGNGLRRFQYMVNASGTSCFVSANGYLFNR